MREVSGDAHERVVVLCLQIRVHGVVEREQVRIDVVRALGEDLPQISAIEILTDRERRVQGCTPLLLGRCDEVVVQLQVVVGPLPKLSEQRIASALRR